MRVGFSFKVALSDDDGLDASWPILINNKCNANNSNNCYNYNYNYKYM